jgi:hypothetical protein
MPAAYGLKHVEAVAREEHFPIKAVERYGQTYYAWNERGKKRRTRAKKDSSDSSDDV